jgi:DnaJ-class molecular chaperone
MDDMRKRSEEQARVEREREEERKKREGSAYKTKEERERDAKAAKEKRNVEDGEARVLDDAKFDPKKDYYGILGLDRAASASEVRAAYKKFALLLHPDKYRSESQEQQDAISERFMEVAKAFDVLTNEDMRIVYDKCRDYMETNPGKGLPTLTPEESMQIQRGAGELSRLRRMGPKLKKHDPLLKQVEVSLEDLQYGCTKPVSVERRRVDYSGVEFMSEKTFHVVIRKGSREGDTLIFDDEGNESVDTHAGDLIFTLAVRPHPLFKRKGEKDLEMFIQTGDPTDILQMIEFETLTKKSFTICFHSLVESLISGGCGGTKDHLIEGQGLFDGYDRPAGNLTVSTRFIPCFVEDKHIVSCVSPGEVALLGSSGDVVGASILSGLLKRRLDHKLETFEMQHDYESCRKGGIVILKIFHDHLIHDTDIKKSAVNAVSSVFSTCNYKTVEYSISTTCGLIDDSFWSVMQDCDLIVLEHSVLLISDAEERLRLMDAARNAMQDVLTQVWQKHMTGCDILAIEGAVELLGKPSTNSISPCILPFYGLRAGGGPSGFDDVCYALGEEKRQFTTCVGVLEGSGYIVDYTTGEAEMIIAPYKEALIRKATWDPPCVASVPELDEADDDMGYMVAYAAT